MLRTVLNGLAAGHAMSLIPVIFLIKLIHDSFHDIKT